MLDVYEDDDDCLEKVKRKSLGGTYSRRIFQFQLSSYTFIVANGCVTFEKEGYVLFVSEQKKQNILGYYYI
jgi:hypothetical protein